MQDTGEVRTTARAPRSIINPPKVRQLNRERRGADCRSPIAGEACRPGPWALCTYTGSASDEKRAANPSCCSAALLLIGQRERH
jgi:hypothetical protein